MRYPTPSSSTLDSPPTRARATSRTTSSTTPAPTPSARSPSPQTATATFRSWPVSSKPTSKTTPSSKDSKEKASQPKSIEVSIASALSPQSLALSPAISQTKANAEKKVSNHDPHVRPSPLLRIPDRHSAHPDLSLSPCPVDAAHSRRALHDRAARGPRSRRRLSLPRGDHRG